jgi:hypothetical protein
VRKIGAVRPKFVDGMLLTAEDLSLEQSYLSRRLIQFGKRFDWGVLEGMEVVDRSSRKPMPTLEVRPGYALDALGHEIVLGEDQECEIAIGKDNADEPLRKIVAAGAVLCVRCYGPDRLAAGTAEKSSRSKVDAQGVLTIERAQFGFLDPTDLKQGIECGWVPLARVVLRADDTFAIVSSQGLTCIHESSWPHGRTSLTSEWWITFSAPIDELPYEAVEIRLRDGTGAFVYPDMTQLDLKLDSAGMKLSFKLAPTAGETVHIRIACDFIIDWKGQAVSGAYVGGRPLSGNGIAGGVFESWVVVEGRYP